MAQILDFNTPSVNPAGAPPNDYLHIQANPGMFGALTGQALEKLGGSFEKAAEAATDVAQLHDRVNVDDQVNRFADTRNATLHGDPGKTVIGPDGQPTQDRGFLGLQGRAAADAREATLKALEDARQAGRRNLTNPMAQVAYDSQTRRLYQDAEARIGSHVDSQWKVWAAGVNAAGAGLELQEFVNSVGDPAKMEAAAHNYINFKVQQAQLTFGNDPKVNEETEAQAKRDLLEAHVNAVAVRDPARAIQILDSNRKTAGLKYDDIYNRLRARADAQRGSEIANEAISNSRGGSFSAPVNDAISSAAQRYGLDPATLRRAAQIESGGNPNAVTGSYKGLFQVSAEEFRKYGPPGGDIFNPYDNAAAAAAKMKAEGAAFASSFGRQPTGFDSYMIHQQGLAGYSMHLANPSAPAWQNMLATGEGREKGERWARQAIWGNIPDQYKALFGSVDNVTSRDFIAMWAAKFGSQAPPMPGGGTGVSLASAPAPQFRFPAEETLYGGQGRGAVETAAFPVPNIAAVIRPNVIQQVLDNREAQASPEVMQHALAAANRLLAAQEIAENQNTKARKEAAEGAADEHLQAMTAMMHSPNPDYVALAGKINSDPRLDYETRKGLLDRVRHMSGEEQALAFGPGYLAARQALFSPSDAPGHISDFSQLVLDPTITTAGLADLRQRLSLVKGDVDHQALERRINSFLIGAKKDLSFEEDNGLIKIRDPKGERIYNYEFVPDFVKRVSDLAQEAQKTGDRRKLDDFLSVENVEKMVRSYRSKKDMDADRLAATGQAAAVMENPNAPLPPAPEGIKEENWKALVSRPPMLTTGQAATHAQWAQALTLLNNDPSPQMIAAFDRYFAPAGLTAMETLKKLNPAASTAAEKTNGVEPEKGAAPPIEKSEFQRLQNDPNNPAVRFRNWIAMGLHPETAKEKRHPEDIH